MNCKIIQQDLFNYVLGDLTPSAKAAVDDHLNACENCSELLKKFQEIESFIAHEKNLTPSTFITTRIMQHLENETDVGKNKVVSLLRPAGLVAGILLAAYIGYGIGKLSLSQSQGYNSSYNTIETLRNDLFIHDFIDKNLILIINE